MLKEVCIFLYRLSFNVVITAKVIRDVIDVIFCSILESNLLHTKGMRQIKKSGSYTLRFIQGIWVIAISILFVMSVPRTTQGQSTDKVKQVIADNFKAIGQEMQAGDVATNSLVITIPV